MIQLPPAFQFSASSLQDFMECARRFQLRYLMAQDWPSPAAEPLAEAEEVYEAGRRFHLLMQRYWLGLPITRAHIDPALLPWWDTFQASQPVLPGTIRRPEVETTAVLHGRRMTAKFDLLAYAPDSRAVIVDWKTSKPTPRRYLDRRLQTIIYPMMLVETSQRLIGWQIAPEDVRLVYWFAGTPDLPETQGLLEIFEYSTARYEEDKRYLAATLNRLLSLEVDVWPLTPNERLCRLCQYRSLCDRGRVAGSLDEDPGEVWPDVEELRGLIASASAMDDYVL